MQTVPSYRYFPSPKYNFSPYHINLKHQQVMFLKMTHFIS